MVTYNINLDLMKEDYTSFKVKQNDDITLKFSIFNNSLTEDLTGATAILNALKNDNTFVKQTEGIIIAKNNITIETLRDITRVPGALKLELVIIKNNKQKTTFSIDVNVVSSIIASNAEVSKNVVSVIEILDNKIAQGKAIVKEVDDTKNNAIDTVNKLKKDTIDTLTTIKDDTIKQLNTTTEEVKTLKKETIEESTKIKDDAIKALEQIKTDSIKELNNIKVIANVDLNKVKADTILEVNRVANEAINSINKYNIQDVSKKIDDHIADNNLHVTKELKDSIAATAKDIDNLKQDFKDNTITSLKTDVLSTKLDGCAGGFVNIEKIQGKTEMINGRLVSVGETVGIGNNLYTLPITKTYITENNTQSAFYFGVKTTGTYDYPFRNSYSVLPANFKEKFVFNSGNINYWELFVGINGNGGGDNKETAVINLKSNTDYLVEFNLVKTNENSYTISNVSIRECAYRIEILSKKAELVPLKSMSVSGKQIVDIEFENIYDTKLGDSFKYYNPRDNVTYVNNAIVKNINGNVLTIDFGEILTTASLATFERLIPNKISDKTEILLPKALDKFCYIDVNGNFMNNSQELYLKGNENWGYSAIVGNYFRASILDYANIINNNEFIATLPSGNVENPPFECMNIQSNNRAIHVVYLKTTLGIVDTDSDSIKIQKLKNYLNNNNVKIINKKNNGIINTNKTLNLRAYDNLIVNAGAIQPAVSYSYAKNAGERVTSIEDSLKGILDKVDSLGEYEKVGLTPLNGFSKYNAVDTFVIRKGNVVTINFYIDPANATFPFTLYTMPIFNLPSSLRPKFSIDTFLIPSDKGLISMFISTNGSVVFTTPTNLAPTAKPLWIIGNITYLV